MVTFILLLALFFTLQALCAALWVLYALTALERSTPPPRDSHGRFVRRGA